MRRLAGVSPRELGAMLEARELSEGSVSARDRPGTSCKAGGEETDAWLRVEGRRRGGYGRYRSDSATDAGEAQ